mgnify:CR=1 FL=1
MAKRIFLIVLDSFGIGAEPDAPAFGDAGTNTLGAIAGHPNFKWDQLAGLGMFNLDGVTCRLLCPPAGSQRRERYHHRSLGDCRSAQPGATANFPEWIPERSSG